MAEVTKDRIPFYKKSKFWIMFITAILGSGSYFIFSINNQNNITSSTFDKSPVCYNCSQNVVYSEISEQSEEGGLSVQPEELKLTCGDGTKISQIIVSNTGKKALFDINLIITTNVTSSASSFYVESGEKLNEKDELFKERLGDVALSTSLYSVSMNLNDGRKCVQPIINSLEPGESVKLKLLYSKQDCAMQENIITFIAHYSEVPITLQKTDTMLGVPIHFYCGSASTSEQEGMISNISMTQLFFQNC